MKARRTPNQTVQRTGASRFAHRQIQRHRRLAPVADFSRYLNMKNAILAALLFLTSLAVSAGNTEDNWGIFSAKDFSETIKKHVPELVVKGGLQTVSAGRHPINIYRRRSALYTVSSEKGFVPELVKNAVDVAGRGKLSRVNMTSSGSQETGFVEHAWSYYHEGSGVAGTLTIWFPNTGGEGAMQMVVVITEWKPTNDGQIGE
jgi:hypothetical protein